MYFSPRTGSGAVRFLTCSEATGGARLKAEDDAQAARRTLRLGSVPLAIFA